MTIAGEGVSGTVQLDVHLAGTGTVVRASGDIGIGNAILAFPTCAVRMDEVLLRLPRDPAEVSRITGHGTTRLRGYAIDLTLSGGFLVPEVALRSHPPLPRPELLQLILEGLAPEASMEELLETSRLAGPERVAIVIGDDTLARSFGDDPAEREAMLDRIRIESSVYDDDIYNVRFILIDGVFSERDDLAFEWSREAGEGYSGGLSFTLRFP